MRILLVGGTRFVGRHVVEAALAAGHDVTIFHRGKTGTALFPDVEHRIGDRNSDLSALADGSWDATVDTCAYLPSHVHELAEVMGDRAGRYQLVSSVSAYASPAPRGYREDAPLAELDDPTVEDVTDETYGGLKVLCERAAVERFGPHSVVVRPTYVVGPDDYTWPFLLAAALDDTALPLWPGADPDELLMTADPAAALATGLTIRPLADTVRDTLAWARTVEQPGKPGISAADEAALLEKWQSLPAG
jgi:2'-hydroxyisoflavone reductase